MRLTIGKKLFWGMSALIMLFVALSQLLNSQFLEDYYVLEKKKQLMDIYSSINKIYQGDADSISLELERLERTTGIHIVVCNSKQEPTYPVKKTIQEPNAGNPPIPQPQNLNQQNSNLPHPGPEKELSFERSLIQLNLDKISEGREAIVFSKDPRIQTNFINLVTTLNNGDYLILNTPFASISESVKIANRFFLFTGLLTLIAGSVITYFMSRKLTMPILKLNDIAQRMARLDFSRKYQVESTDEVGQLGESINSLSTQLHGAISELTEANKKLLEDIERERRIDQMRKEFISNVSHELKTPISLIQGYAEGLKENVNEDEENKNFYCAVIADEAKKMDKLAGELLDLSQIEAGTFKLEKSNFEISRLAAKVMDKYQPIFSEKKINCNLMAEQGLIVYADRFRTEQILVNYLNNAINHVDSQRLITISVQSTQDKARVAVYNSGQPIPEESLGKVWDSFYKVDKARTRSYGGTGLGLSIVRAIQEIDNNRYGVLNKWGGVEFWFELDVAE
ncbi:sensor histidine kinase [Pelotomaculum propionicicum]|uniref:histidine kinase n=1 Tax=Pelotomaculum propionicicum TaxID=258475 RepID=A0A4Y7RW55_9FIRM|nr:HAMP domain-containing sensor histidine kinase [Pelotomaculum propionicicum]NLI12288.1 HAMP domain-containing protein [Peptococcaceae bacterium]TEB12959.1 Sensor histidine kinase ResE [Pelotomaculum propionicicum]